MFRNMCGQHVDQFLIFSMIITILFFFLHKQARCAKDELPNGPYVRVDSSSQSSRLSYLYLPSWNLLSSSSYHSTNANNYFIRSLLNPPGCQTADPTADTN